MIKSPPYVLLVSLLLSTDKGKKSSLIIYHFFLSFNFSQGKKKLNSIMNP